MAEVGWIEKLSRLMLSWFSQRQVKTPLSFYFRVVIALLLLSFAGMIAAPAELTFKIFLTGICVLVGLSLRRAVEESRGQQAFDVIEILNRVLKMAEERHSKVRGK